MDDFSQTPLSGSLRTKSYGIDLLSRLVSAYQEDSTEIFIKLEKAIADGDLTAVAETARSMHKAAEILFSEKVCAIAHELEMAASSSGMEAIRSLAKILAKENRRFVLLLNYEIGPRA